MTTTKHGNFVTSKCKIKVTVRKPACDGASSRGRKETRQRKTNKVSEDRRMILTNNKGK